MRLKRREQIGDLRHLGIAAFVLQTVRTKPYDLGKYAAKSAKPRNHKIRLRRIGDGYRPLTEPGGSAKQRQRKNKQKLLHQTNPFSMSFSIMW